MAQLLQTDRTGETAAAAALLGATFEDLAPVMNRQCQPLAEAHKADAGF